MSYAHVSSSSIELLPVLSTAPRTSVALPVEGRAKPSPALRPVRYPAIELAERALYLSLAGGFAVALYGFIGMLHL